MRIEEYLKLVLPEEGNGYYCVSVLKHDTGRFYNKLQARLADVVAFANKVNATTPHSVYVATNTFQTPDNRKQVNAQAAKSFFLDMDVGANKPYTTQRAAVDAIKEFCDASGFQFPIILSSGNGIYAVWPLSQSIPSVVWSNTASLFAKILDTYGVKPDPAITANSSAVLRPDGTLNKKDQENYKPVQIVKSTVTAYSAITPKQFISMLGEAMRRKKMKLDTTKKTKSDTFNFFDNIEEHRPFSIDKAANKCAQLNLLRSVRGNVDEPLWYAGLGVAAFTEDAEAIHAYSDGHPYYNPEQTEAKAEQWRSRATGATTCKKFHELNPVLCATCPYFGRINSPIKLGYPDPAGLSQPVIHNISYEPPKGFRRTEAGLQVQIDDEWVTFYPYDIYPVSVAFDSGLNTEVATFRHKLPHENYVEFQFETKIFADSRRFHEMLLGNGISILSQDSLTRMKFYMGGYLERIRANQARDTLHGTMGWKDRDSSSPYFILGENAIQQDGTIKTVGISRSAPEIVRAFSTKGDENKALNGFRTISDLYNFRGMEPLAFALLCSIGSPLMSFTGLSGATVSLVGKSGSGKTLTGKLALSAYGDPYKLLMLVKDSEKFTQKRFGVYANLPVVIDEITNASEETISDLLYDVTNGRDRGTLKRDRSDREGSSWCTVGLVTTNTYLSSKLMFKADATAELNRLVELPVDQETAIDQKRGRAVDKFIRENHGHVGRQFVSTLLRNYDRIPDLLEVSNKKVNAMFESRADERFASALLSVAYATGETLTRMGLITFDFKRVIRWTVDQIAKEREVRTEAICNPGDALARFAAENLGATLLIGYIETPGRGISASHLNPSASPNRVHLRYNYRFDKPEESTLQINIPAFADWLNRTMQMDIRQVKEWLLAHGYFTGASRNGKQPRQSLGAHTSFKLPAIATWTLRLQAIGTDIAESNVASIARSDPLFGDAVKEIKRRCAARRIPNPFDPAIIVDAIDIDTGE